MAVASTPPQGWSAFTSLTYASRVPEGTPAASGSASAIAIVPDLSISDFNTWSPDSQKLYLLANGTGTPPTIRLPGATYMGDRYQYDIRLGANGLESLLSYQGDREDVWQPVSAGTLDRMPNAATLTAETFASWKPQHQSAYLWIVAPGSSQLALPNELGTATAFGLAGGAVVSRVATTGLEPTPGMILGGTLTADGQRSIPYYHLPGSSSGASGALVKAGAEALFPDLDGTAGRELTGAKPDGFATAAAGLTSGTAKAFLAKFQTWHSSHQMEWFVANAAGARTIERPAGAPLLSLFRTSETPPRLINLAGLTKEQFGFLPAADQRLVAATAMFTLREIDLGLSAITYTGGSIDRTTGGGVIVQEIDDLIAKVRSGLPDADEGVFTQQLDILKAKVLQSGAVDVTGLRARIGEISKRYERAENYYWYGEGGGSETTRTVYTSEGGASTKIPDKVNSLDGGASIRAGYQVMIAQERRLAENAAERWDVANGTTTSLNGKRFDVATLIYYFQNKYNLDLEAVVTVETEAVKQLNAYLKDYALWQDQVNSTSSKFSKDDIDKGNKKGLNGWNNDLIAAYASDPNSEKGKLFKLALMFEDSNGYWQHPVEDEKGGDFKRPDNFDIFVNYDSPSNDDQKSTNWDLAQHTQGEWNTYATRLGDKVTQLNQDSQQRMNEINNKDKQRNRHYDLANSALSKMNDALQSILRATA